MCVYANKNSYETLPKADDANADGVSNGYQPKADHGDANFIEAHLRIAVLRIIIKFKKKRGHKHRDHYAGDGKH